MKTLVCMSVLYCLVVGLGTTSFGHLGDTSRLFESQNFCARYYFTPRSQMGLPSIVDLHFLDKAAHVTVRAYCSELPCWV